MKNIKLRNDPSVFIVSSLIFIIALSISIYEGIQFYQYSFKFNSSAKCYIERKWWERHGRSTVYYYSLIFKYQGKVYNQSRDILLNLNPNEQGDSVLVYFDKNYPEEICFKEEKWDHKFILMFILAYFTGSISYFSYPYFVTWYKMKFGSDRDQF